MTTLTIYPTDDRQSPTTIQDFEAIQSALTGLGIRFERWQADRELTNESHQDEVIAAYRAEVDRLKAEQGFQSVDVVSLHPEHPDREVLRAKFLAEHTHDEDEVRFFVDGQGLFYVHIEDRVYSLLCEKNDLLNVPAGTKHWFDMGARPDFKCIRLFTRPDGWVAQFTGDTINERYPLLGEETL